MVCQVLSRLRVWPSRSAGAVRRRARVSFTLLELVVVVVVLGVLTSVAVVGYNRVVDNSQDEAARYTLTSVMRATQALSQLDGDGVFEAEQAVEAAEDLPDSWALTSPLAAQAGTFEVALHINANNIVIAATESESGNAVFACASQISQAVHSWVESSVPADPTQYDQLAACVSDPGAPGPSLTTPTTLVAPFTGLTARLETGGGRLNWDVYPDAVNYRVFRNTVGVRSSASELTSTPFLAAGVSTFYDPGLADSTLYHYWVEVTSTSGDVLSQSTTLQTGTTTTYTFTGSCTPITFPAGSGTAQFELAGAQGGVGSRAQGDGGLGGSIVADVDIDPAGETLRLCIGGQGQNGTGGFNGGGSTTLGIAGGGGGATDLRRDSLDGIPGNWSLADRILVAGGGGGAGAGLSGQPVRLNGGVGSGSPYGGPAGHHYGAEGASDAFGGLGGKTSSLGTNNTAFASSGSLGVGAPGLGGGASANILSAGGGGGGWYGGGAGGVTSAYLPYPGSRVGAGGGGNGYADPSVGNHISESGVRSGNGVAAVTFGALPIPVSVDAPLAPLREFTCLGGYNRWRVPAGVTQIVADLQGSKGVDNDESVAGNGGRIAANVDVTPLEVIQLAVGCNSFGDVRSSVQIDGGFNGGVGSRSGGGATDIRFDANNDGTFGLDERVLVAGGGGGAGGAGGVTVLPIGVADGGHGSGGLGATRGDDQRGGAPGQADRGGLGGLMFSTFFAPDGSFGAGGAGTSSGSAAGSRSGGGGGGGWYGGGAGGSDGPNVSILTPGGQSGGGGGIGYADPAVTSMVSSWTGVRDGTGTASISWGAPLTSVTSTADDLDSRPVAFTCLTDPQRFQLPSSVSDFDFTLRGAPGGGSLGGAGGQLDGVASVDAGSVVWVHACFEGATPPGGNSGGAAADLRVDFNNDGVRSFDERLASAAGGGGGGRSGQRRNIAGGEGGVSPTAGGSEVGGPETAGQPATALAGGVGGVYPTGSGTGVDGLPGSFGLGGLGNGGGSTNNSTRSGGSGGQGWFGGGSGSWNTSLSYGPGSGGGGGFSYADPTYTVSVVGTTGTVDGAAMADGAVVVALRP